MRLRIYIVAVISLTFVIICPTQGSTAQHVRERLWIWGQRAGTWNNDYIKPLGKASTIEPADAAAYMGIYNMFYVRYDETLPMPFKSYYPPLKDLSKVMWSIVGAGGMTYKEEREDAYKLARENPNIAGFVLDDFFREADDSERQWLAENNVVFPVQITLTPSSVVTCDSMELMQSNWRSGEYRTREIAIDVMNADGWQELATAMLPNKPAAAIKVSFPSVETSKFRIRILSTYDTTKALSCGLSRIRLYSNERKIVTNGWKSEASSGYPGHSVDNLLITADSSELIPFNAALSPAELQQIRQEMPAKAGRNLPVAVTLYAHQISPRILKHLQLIDQVVLWTWAPESIKDMEQNLAKLEKLAPGKSIMLGCYMYDFNARRPISIDLMKMQSELGLKWLKQGRIQGIIFLGTPCVDIGLDAVEWTRQWIKEVGEQEL